ncbi:MAG TPA: hypothetical protein VGI39_04600 [Polyangiaceae bacterium]|jgi:hypothetical protein
MRAPDNEQEDGDEPGARPAGAADTGSGAAPGNGDELDRAPVPSDFLINVEELRAVRRRSSPPPGSDTRASSLAKKEGIGETKADPRLRPFVVAMANAIIKDMLREKKEGR